MASSFAFIIALLFTFVNAGKFSLPLYQNNNERAANSINKRHENEGRQKPLQNGPGQEIPLIDTNGNSHHKPSSTLKDSGYWFYTTNLTLGTPPQSFRAIVDLNAVDLFVPSIACGGAHCNDDTKEKYDPSASSTFHENGTILQEYYNSLHAFGIVNEDTLRLGELEVPGQQFLELRYYQPVYLDQDILQFDSVLGLGYDGTMLNTPRHQGVLSSPFHTIVEQGILDENKFALRIPKEGNTAGDLTLGGYDEDVFDGDLVSHPLYPENTTYWNIQATSLAMTSRECGRDTILFNSTLSNHTAALRTTRPGIQLPSHLAQRVLWKINVKRSACTYHDIVDCDAVSSLPHITIGLPGQEVVLKGEDYTMRYEDDNPRFCQHPVKECWLLIEEAPNRADWPRDLIILGTAFLKNVYTVFDWDRRSVSFGKPKS